MLKLGTQTGSVVNHIHSRAVIGQPEPEVGMGATLLGWTDRHAATIVAVETVGKALIVTVQEDTARRTDKNGFSETQTWEFARNPDAFKLHYRRAENGMWARVRYNDETKRWNKVDGGGLMIGRREHYYDPSF